MTAPSRDEFVKIAVERLGEGSPTELANRLKLGANGYQKVYRWLRGAEPGYANTIAMLDMLGWLYIEGEAEASPRDGNASRSQPEAERLADVVLRLERIADLLEPVTDRLVPPRKRASR